MENGAQVILVVDDEQGLREGLSRILEDEGYRIFSAESGERALEIVRRQHIDLILTDIRMPGMSGIELLKKVRAIHEDMGVIMLTGYGEIDSYIEAMNFGAMEYVSKPFKMNELKFIVRKVLKHSSES